jgi:S-adenosylmethionine/arginine decarboxylase-like enzyme
MHGMFAGWHLTYDAITEPDKAAGLNDIEFLERVLLDLVEMLGMDVLDGPRLQKVELDRAKLETDEDEGGVRGTVVLSASHISIHTWPLRHRFSLDAFSCREYDEDAVQAFLKERMFVKKRSSHWIKRLWP